MINNRFNVVYHLLYLVFRLNLQIIKIILMIGILYKDYSNDFVNYVTGLIRHNVKLNDMRLKQICKKWDIGIIDDGNGGYWINGEWDDNLQNHINMLVSLKV